MFEPVSVEEMIEWIERHASVQRGDGYGVVPAMLRDIQLDALRKSKAVRLERDTTVTIKPRQIGSSTTWLLAICFLMKKCPGITIVWISQDDTNARAIRRKWNIIVESVQESPGANYPATSTDNSNEFQLDNKSTLVWCYAGNTKAAANKVGRGDTIDLMVWTELAYWEHAEDTINSILPAAEKGDPSILIDSTCNGTEGEGEVFFRYSMMAYEGTLNHTLLFWPWWKDRDYVLLLSDEEQAAIMETLSDEEKGLVYAEGLTAGQIAWRRLKISSHKEKFFEIYPETIEHAFLTSMSSVFSQDILRRIATYLRLSPPARVDLRPYLRGRRPISDLMVRSDGSREGWVRAWVRPEDAVGRVTAGVDGAFGNEDGDWQAVTLVDEEGVILAMAKLKTSLIRAADVAQQLFEIYDARYLVEGEGAGLQIASYIFNDLHDKMSEKHDISSAVLEAYTAVVAYPKSNLGPGLVPINRKTRPIVVGLFTEFLGEGLTDVPDEAILAEMRSLEDKGNGRIEHAKNFNDDILFSFGYALLGRRIVLLSGRRSDRRRIARREVEPPAKYGFFGNQKKAPRKAKRAERRKEESRLRERSVSCRKVRDRARRAGRSVRSRGENWFS
jgi:hypothetical protein